MTDEERTARLEGIVETWNRVLDEHRSSTDRRIDAIEQQIAEDRRRLDAFQREMREMYWRAMVAFGIGLAAIGLMIRYLTPVAA